MMITKIELNNNNNNNETIKTSQEVILNTQTLIY
jgi:hypothetical protein